MTHWPGPSSRTHCRNYRSSDTPPNLDPTLTGQSSVFPPSQPGAHKGRKDPETVMALNILSLKKKLKKEKEEKKNRPHKGEGHKGEGPNWAPACCSPWLQTSA